VEQYKVHCDSSSYNKLLEKQLTTPRREANS